jgi:hypothetical protein
MLERISMISFWDDATGHGATAFGGYFDGIRDVISGNRARRRTLARYNDLIEHADQHMLKDLGVRRSDLFRMRDALFDN